MIEQWLQDIKKECRAEDLGMILIHNGIVRATGKDGRSVRAMKLTYDRARLEKEVDVGRRKEGIAAIRVWINEGILQVGDDIMNLCVAGRFRTDVLPAFEALLTMIKTEIVREEEI